MKQKHACLMCIHFRPIQDPEWKPSYDTDKYDWVDVRNKIRETKGVNQAGHCHLNPSPVKVMTNQECSQFNPMEYAVVEYSDFIWGSPQARNVDQAQEQIKELTRQLKVAREISRNRLQRLEKLIARNKNAADSA